MEFSQEIRGEIFSIKNNLIDNSINQFSYVQTSIEKLMQLYENNKNKSEVYLIHDTFKNWIITRNEALKIQKSIMEKDTNKVMYDFNKAKLNLFKNIEDNYFYYGYDCVTLVTRNKLVNMLDKITSIYS